MAAGGDSACRHAHCLSQRFGVLWCDARQDSQHMGTRAATTECCPGCTQWQDGVVLHGAASIESAPICVGPRHCQGCDCICAKDSTYCHHTPKRVRVHSAAEACLGTEACHTTYSYSYTLASQSCSSQFCLYVSLRQARGLGGSSALRGVRSLEEAPLLECCPQCEAANLFSPARSGQAAFVHATRPSITRPPCLPSLPLYDAGCVVLCGAAPTALVDQARTCA